MERQKVFSSPPAINQSSFITQPFVLFLINFDFDIFYFRCILTKEDYLEFDCTLSQLDIDADAAVRLMQNEFGVMRER